MFYALCISGASFSVHRSMTALTVVTGAVPTECCVDEHMTQDGEVCIHPPLQRHWIVSIAICLVILAHCSKQRAQADVCQTQELNSCETECCCLTSWRNRLSPRGPLCSMLGVARISTVVPRRFSALTYIVFDTKAMNRIIAVLPQSVDKSQESFPQRSTVTPA